jgi:predicted TIM-barrel fold metal-dependent hydrolase
MIIDVHAHYWPDASVFSHEAIQEAERARGGPVNLVTDYADYWANAPEATRTIIFGGKARLSGIWQDDQQVAEFAASAPDRLIGFLSLDLTHPGWREELEFEASRSQADADVRRILSS